MQNRLQEKFGSSQRLSMRDSSTENMVVDEYLKFKPSEQAAQLLQECPLNTPRAPHTRKFQHKTGRKLPPIKNSASSIDSFHTSRRSKVDQPLSPSASFHQSQNSNVRSEQKSRRNTDIKKLTSNS